MVHRKLKIGYFSAVFLVLFLTVVMVSFVHGASLGTPTQNQTLLVKVRGFDDGLEFLSHYRVNVVKATAERISTVRQQPNTPRELSGRLMRELTGREEARRQAIKHFNLPKIPKAKWVSPSPDGKRIIVGFEDPLAYVMRNLVVVEAGSLKKIREFTYSGSNYILDVEWSSDSQVVAILETKERNSLAPLHLLYWLSGHGVLLETISVKLFNIGSGDVYKTLIGKDIKFGTGVITRANDETKGGK